eukprot:scaffold20903_cov99-Isochrysis_galbana.AAC.2
MEGERGREGGIRHSRGRARASHHRNDSPHPPGGYSDPPLSRALCSRQLSRPDGPHGVSPPVLLAYFMAVMLGVVGLFSAAGRASGLDAQPGWEWTRLQPPTGIAEWGLLMVYCLLPWHLASIALA